MILTQILKQKKTKINGHELKKDEENKPKENLNGVKINDINVSNNSVTLSSNNHHTKEFDEYFFYYFNLALIQKIEIMFKTNNSENGNSNMRARFKSTDDPFEKR